MFDFNSAETQRSREVIPADTVAVMDELDIDKALLPKLYTPTPRPSPGVHPTAVVGAGVTLGADVCGEAHSVVGDGATRGYHAGHLLSTIGHFRIVREIGRGGAGVVYLAEDVDIPGRRVALKRLQPEVAAMDAEVLRREAAVLAAIEHPHILIVHEVGVAEDGLYLVTEYMPEGSMADRIDRGPLTTAEALIAARQAASALAAAHERGILHRDVKPANLLLAADGRVKVSDFGLAMHTVPPAPEGVETTRTVTLDEGSGKLFGTPLYIPPEALAGLAPTPAADATGAKATSGT